MTRRLVLCLVLALSACVAHERNGDRAAAIGDWKRALAEYREALSRDPDRDELRQKFASAKKEAASGAFRKAQTCATTEDWPCAVKEADYALSIDDGNSEIAAFRVKAAKELALSAVESARRRGQRGDYAGAFGALASAEKSSSDDDVKAAAVKARAELVTAGTAEVQRLRTEHDYPRAAALVGLLEKEDASVGSLADTVRQEEFEWRAAEYTRHVGDGRAALARLEWDVAAEAFDAALAMRRDVEAETCGRYSHAVGDSERAITRRDYSLAGRALRVALDSGCDQGGYAASRLDAVEVRPYAIQIQAVLAKATRPDGQPWVGPPNPLLGSLIKIGANVVMPGVGGRIASEVVDAVESVPPKNRPTMHVQVTMPDSRRLLTPSRNGIYVTYDSQFLIATNQLDSRQITFKVQHRDGSQVDDVGSITVPLKDLIVAKQLVLQDASIAGLQVTAAPSTEMTDGMFVNMAPARDPLNEAESFSVPTRGAQAFRLNEIAVRGAGGDFQDEFGMDGPPDLYVTVEQRGKVVYRSPKAQDHWQAEWRPQDVELWVAPDERLTVSLWDKDVSDDDLIGRFEVAGAALHRGRIDWGSIRGSAIRFVATPRPAPAL